MNKKNNPEVSVIIPVYNAENTIERCLNSVLSQTINSIEIITINDCSTDNSLSILKKYEKKYKNLIVINNESNLGPAASRNKGLDIASGKYVGFVDSDDYIDNNMYQEMASYMNKETDLVTCSRYRNTKNGMKVIINETAATDPKELSKISNYTADKLFKNSIIKKYSIRFPNKYRYAEDFYFLTVYRCYSKKMKTLEYPFYHIDYNPNSITNSYNKNILNIVDVLSDLKSFLEENNFYTDLSNEYLKVCAQYYVRRISEFGNFSNFKLKKSFTKRFLSFFKNNFSNYKNDIQKFKTKNNRRRIYRTNYILMLIYIFYTDLKYVFKKK